MTNVLELFGLFSLENGTFSINLREAERTKEKNSSEVIQISFDNKRAQMEEMCHQKWRRKEGMDDTIVHQKTELMPSKFF